MSAQIDNRVRLHIREKQVLCQVRKDESEASYFPLDCDACCRVVRPSNEALTFVSLLRGFRIDGLLTIGCRCRASQTLLSRQEPNLSKSGRQSFRIEITLQSFEC